MGRKFVTVYTFLSIIILIGILGFTFFRIQTVRDDRLQTARYSFARIRGSIEGALAAEKSFKSPAFRSAIDSSFLTLPPLQLVVIYSYDKGIYYLRARNSEVLSTPPSELDSIKGLPQFDYNTFTQCKITSSLAVPPDTTYLLDALFLLFNPAELVPIFRDSILILIIFSGITAVVYLMGRRQEPLITAHASSTHSPTAPAPAAPPDIVTMPAGMAAATASESPGSSSQQKKTLEEEEVPQCLFSPTTGIGWQEHLEKRLSLELERAAFNEQDLTLVLLQVPGINKTDEAYISLAKSIQSSIAFEDLVFEYGEDGITIVLPNSSLEQSITTLKSFLKKLDPSIVEKYTIPHCGLSSRSGRLVDGKQLIREASEALKKAGSTLQDCIVGFKVDPGKYREYLASRELSHSVPEGS